MRFLNSKILPILLIGGIGVQTIFAEMEQRFDFRIKAADADGAFQRIIEFAEKKGGYFTSFDGYSVSIRLPVNALEEFSAALASLAQIEDKNFQSLDRSADLERLASQIQSRKKLLESYIGLVKNAPFAELQSVEREMASLNAQIERLQGQKQAIEKRSALALITVHAYQPPPSLQPANDERSPFAWINSVNLNWLKGDF